MDYHLEQLGDERFQKLCQALLVACYPDLICLPVGQPDGGRDAVTKNISNDKQSEHIVFQVKFVKDPKTRDARDFIEEIIKSEGEKVTKLKSKGVTKYYLLTNVMGTSHLDVGSIDKVNRQLTKSLDIDAHCWWRDDLERRIDTHTGIKWSFPEILKATDLLEELLKNSNDTESKRKSDTLKSYMAHQARYDSQLKFKQIELQKGIIDLFVDIPAQFISALTEEQQNIQDHLTELLTSTTEQNKFTDDDLSQDEDDVEIFGALQLMIHPTFSKLVMGAVIEGAPGQGKSTVTQYLCQVNRLILLGRLSDTSRIDKSHLPVEARIPFRVDLRDYASWLSGRDPFSDDQEESTTTKRSPLLESFIAAQINRYTGTEFSVEDLISVSKSSQLLIVLDGFDEVADTKLRNKIVSEVSDAAVRIKENALSSQIIVTSRPTAFANSPGFSRNEWQHIKMLPLSRPVIESYATKWLDGRSTEQREKDEILAVLAEKLEHSHVRDLARNPMQLAILLALISVQGASLPDKRTALYDSYINIFLNRESEKSKIVRDHRELLIQIHRYLAWVLHSEAEEKSQAGNISEARLREILHAFLELSGHPSKLVDELFSGMVERVVALVSRVQGTFEFEVQPLREYFAARYLYDTAPYSPAGSAHQGTLPERFDAIARNFYWLNVTRFYAGCYSYGELSSLIDGLDELAESEQLKYIAQPSRLGILLLRDYVFNQHPRLASRVITKIISNPGFRVLIGGAWTQRNAYDDLTLPPGASREILVSKCFEIIEHTLRYDNIYIASKTLTQNCNYEELHTFWNNLRNKNKNRALIIQTGSALGIFEKLSKSEIIELINEYGNKVLSSILRHQRFDLLENDEDIFSETFINYAMHSGNGFLFFNKHTPTLPPRIIAAYTLATLGSNYFLSQISDEPHESDVHSFLSSSAAFRGHLVALENYKPNLELQETANEHKINSLINTIKKLYETKFEEIKTNYTKWEELIELFRSLWGDGSNLNAIAIQISDLFEYKLIIDSPLKDSKQSLVSRAISAKQNINNPEWLSKQLSAYDDAPENIDLLLRSIVKWGETKTFINFANDLSTTFDTTPTEVWDAFANSFGYHNFLEESKTIEIQPTQLEELPENLSSRFASILIQMVNDDTKLEIRNRYLASYNGTDHFILEAEISSITNAAWSNPDYWPLALKAIRDGYSRSFTYNFDPSRVYSDDFELPLMVAQEICANSDCFPVDILSVAESAILADIGKSVTPVGRVASDNCWFTES